MAKEIHEQPEVVGHTARPLHRHGHDAKLKPFAWPARSEAGEPRLASPSSPAATALYGGASSPNTGSRRFARLAGRDRRRQSEYRYREAPVDKGGLTIVISQSGETADTLACAPLREGATARSSIGVVNVATGSSIARLRPMPLAPTLGGARDRRRLDQGFHLSACRAWRRSRIGAWPGARRARRTRRRPALVGRTRVLTPGLLVAEALKLEPASRAACPRTSRGRAMCSISAAARPIRWRIEGALKLKELSLHPRRGLRGGRTQAWADRVDRRGRCRSSCIAPRDAVFEKTVSLTCRKSPRAAAASC